MLHALRKLKIGLGRTIASVLLLAWLGGALQPCVMASGHSISNASASHDCCLPAPGKQAPAFNDCSAQNCALQSVDQQQTDTFFHLALTFTLALVLTLAWPRCAGQIQQSHRSRAPAHRLHPTLAYCTLLI